MPNPVGLYDYFLLGFEGHWGSANRNGCFRNAGLGLDAHGICCVLCCGQVTMLSHSFRLICCYYWFQYFGSFSFKCILLTLQLSTCQR